MITSNTTLTEWQKTVADWGEETFPVSSWSSVLAHLTEEILELHGLGKPAIKTFLGAIQEASASAETQNAYELGCELIDVQLLVFHAARKLNIEFEQMLADKMNENRARNWNTTAEPAGHFKHIEEANGTGWIAGTNPTNSQLREFGRRLHDCITKARESGEKETYSVYVDCMDKCSDVLTVVVADPEQSDEH